MTETSSMKRLLGFERKDVSSWHRLVSLLHRPMDPAGLALFRIGFGLLMALDTVEERGLGWADHKWGNVQCRFPLIHSMGVLPLEWMYAVYICMFIGAVGICLGAFYRISCAMFACCYWYIFLLDKQFWNNHSYLYGLLSLILLNSDAHRYWSVDGWLRPSIRNSHIPLYNHALLRFQFFLVYFFGGLKKLDMDWIMGYSMGARLGMHWVFYPFRQIMSIETVNLVIVHWGGLVLDLTSGFLLFFDKTRHIGLFNTISFHLMNAFIFNIGMFSYAMLWCLPLFFYPDWPRRCLSYLPSCRLTADHPIQENHSCVYADTQNNNEEIKTSSKEEKKSEPKKAMGLRWYRHVAAMFVVSWVSWQLFMPWSHGITKGYNNWQNGLYGYSWDMMVASWQTQHTRITYKDKLTGEVGYLTPHLDRQRWAQHADMLHQYAICLKGQLEEHGHQDVEIYFDIWRSMNQRFQQRVFDPRVDILTASWHPLKKTPWVLPMLSELSDWRTKMTSLEQDISKNISDYDVVFVADFPGLSLDNYIQEDFNASLEVLNGEVVVELISTDDISINKTLKPGDSLQLPPGEFHTVHTVSAEPSCYMYMYTNQTYINMREEKLQEIKKNATEQGSVCLDDSCFYIFEDKVSWNEAKSLCETAVEGGSLARIKSPEMFSILVELGNAKSLPSAWLGYYEGDGDVLSISPGEFIPDFSSVWPDMVIDDTNEERFCVLLNLVNNSKPIPQGVQCKDKIAYLCQASVGEASVSDKSDDQEPPVENKFQQPQRLTFWGKLSIQLTTFAKKKMAIYKKSFEKSSIALESIWRGVDMKELLEEITDEARADSDSTKKPTEPTNASPEPTKTPTEPAKAKPEPTNIPTEPAKATPEPTKAKPEPIKAPAEPAKTPTEPVKTKPEPIKTPTEPIKTPTEPAKAKLEPTKAPTEPVKAKPEPIKTPTEPAKAKPEPTKAPIEPSKAKPEPTKAPVEPAKAKPEPTKAPVEPAKVKPEPTKAPVEPTKAKPEPTKAPIEPAKAPVEPAKAKPEPTKAPIEPAKAKPEPTKAPVEPAKAKPEPTKAPVEPAKAPVEPAKTKPEPINTPTEPTKTPTEPAKTEL